MKRFGSPPACPPMSSPRRGEPAPWLCDAAVTLDIDSHAKADTGAAAAQATGPLLSSVLKGKLYGTIGPSEQIAFWSVEPLMRVLALASAFLLAVSVSEGQSFDKLRGSVALDACQTLEVCLANLDRVTKTPFGATSDDDPKVSKYLQRFGEPAKLALLERAARADPGWSNYAGALLMDWPNFTVDDVPLLIAALKRQPGGWVARPLGRIATPEAIAALANDVGEHGAMSQSGVALQKLGAKAIPYLMPLLERDKGWRNIDSIITDMGDAVAFMAPDWTMLALDSQQPGAKRIAALRALAAIAPQAASQGPKLRPLLRDPSAAIRATVANTLQAMADNAILESTVQACLPATEPYSALNFNTQCLARIAAFGSNAKPYGTIIAKRFLTSPNGTDRNVGAAVLGYIGDESSIPTLIVLLRDPDWRVVYAAARSLGWLHAVSAIPALTEIATTHWLPPVRDMAQAALDTFKPSALPLAKPAVRVGHSMPPDVRLEIDATFAPDIAPCVRGKWRFGERVFGEPDERHMRADSGAEDAGEYEAADNGEWGGGVSWHLPGRKPDVPFDTANSEGVETSSTGAVGVFGEVGFYTAYEPVAPDKSLETVSISNGASGFGYVLSLMPDKDGTVHTKEIARLPRAADVMTTIGPDLFAVWSGGRVVVFSPEGIRGLAACVTR